MLNDFKDKVADIQHRKALSCFFTQMSMSTFIMMAQRKALMDPVGEREMDVMRLPGAGMFVGREDEKQIFQVYTPRISLEVSEDRKSAKMTLVNECLLKFENGEELEDYSALPRPGGGERKNVSRKVRNVRKVSGREREDRTHAEARRAWRGTLLHKRTKRKQKVGWSAGGRSALKTMKTASRHEKREGRGWTVEARAARPLFLRLPARRARRMFFLPAVFFRLTMVRCRTILPGMKRNLGHLLSLLHERSAKWLSGEMAGAGLGGLAPSHGDVLACLFQRGGATMHELAAFARRTKPTTTILVDKLEALGYVSRGPSPADARSTIVSLTPAGEALRPAFDDISRRYCDFLYSGLSPREAATLERLLEKSLAAPTGTPPRRPTVKPSNLQTPKPPKQRRIP